jgi:hypothetical protein
MHDESAYLRDKAHYCVALARDCQDLTTSHALEALGVELMEKAAELENSRSLAPQSQGDGRRPKRAQRRRDG